MPKQYDIQKEKWKKAEDVYMTRDEARVDDIVIPVMGSAGAGKSTFINNVLDALGATTDRAAVDDSYEPCTSTVAHYVVDLPPTFSHRRYSENRRLVLVDTPGFNHASFSNAEILRRIAVWLASSYGDGVKVAGVVYVHSVVPKRMTGGHACGLEIFKQLCGEEALPGITLATTWWELCKPELGPSMESDLRDGIWQELLSGPQRAAMVRLENTPSSALNLVRTIIDKMPDSRSGIVLLLQRQIVDRKKSYDKTAAGLVAKPRAEFSLSKAAEIFRNFIMNF